MLVVTHMFMVLWYYDHPKSDLRTGQLGVRPRRIKFSEVTPMASWGAPCDRLTGKEKASCLIFSWDIAICRHLFILVF